MIFKTLNNVLKILKHKNNNNLLRYFTSNTQRPKPYSTFKLGLIGVGIGTVVGLGYYIPNLNKSPTYHQSEQYVLPAIKDVPKIEPSRKVVIPNDNTGLKLTLYQYQTCPFCCKVRAFLDYYGISYDIIEVDPVLRQSIKWSQYKKVPILLSKNNDEYQQLNDSTMIISALASLMIQNDKRRELSEIVKYYPVMKYEENNTVKSEILNRYFLMSEDSNNSVKEVEKIMEEQRWRKWADNVLVHSLSPNVYRSVDEAFQAFNWFSKVGQWEENFPTWERLIMIYVGALAMWIISKRLKKRHNLSDDVRQTLYDQCNLWANEIKKKGTKFMGGSKPNLADLAVYGVLSSIEGCSAFEDLSTNSSILPWYLAMREVVNNHSGIQYL